MASLDIVGLVGSTIGISMLFVAWEDARTGRVKIMHSQTITAYVLACTILCAFLIGAESRLVEAAAGALMVTTIQLVPYLLQTHGRPGLIGKADVRLAVPYGWGLGWLGIGFVFLGFGITLVSALAIAFVTRKKQVRFVPYMALGLWVAWTWRVLGPQVNTVSVPNVSATIWRVGAI